MVGLQFLNSRNCDLLWTSLVLNSLPLCWLPPDRLLNDCCPPFASTWHEQVWRQVLSLWFCHSIFSVAKYLGQKLYQTFLSWMNTYTFATSKSGIKFEFPSLIHCILFLVYADSLYFGVICFILLTYMFLSKYRLVFCLVLCTCILYLYSVF